LLEVLRESIERNFSGELYQITDVNRKIESAVALSTTMKTKKKKKKKKAGSLKDRLKKNKTKTKKPKVEEEAPVPEENTKTMSDLIFGKQNIEIEFEGNHLYNNLKELIYISGLANLYRYQIANKRQIKNLKKFIYETSS
jgi:hypothetical protein